MKPYAPDTGLGRMRAIDYVNHKTCDVPSAARKTTAKQLRHGARQKARRDIKSSADQLTGERA
jgi:hypothetical protein